MSTSKQRLATAVANPSYSYIPLSYDLGGYMLPEYGFGSWLGQNAGGLLKGAGSIVSMIPGFGTIAGPILSVAGSVVDKVKSNKMEKNAAQKEVDLKVKQDTQLALQKENATRAANLFSDPQLQYGPTFAFGGNLMTSAGGMMMDPQIVNYSDKADKHSEGIGGIPVDARGNPSKTSRMSAVGLTEGGEVTWNGYVFSNKLKVKK